MRTRDPFQEGSHDAGQHYRLAFYGALLLLREIVPDWVPPAAYRQELAAAGIDAGPEAAAGQWRRWDARLADWEGRAPDGLPLVRLRDVAGLDRMATLLTVLCALPDEDPRLGRSTLGLLQSCWDEPAERAAARTALTRLRECGIVHVADGEGVCSVDPQLAGWLHERPPAGWLAAERLPALPALILPPDLAPRIQAAAAMLRSGSGRFLIIRGSRGTGRRTLIRALATTAGLGVLEVEGEGEPSAVTGTLAALLGALPVLSPPSESGTVAAVPRLAVWGGPVALRLAARVTADCADGAFSLDVTVPGPAQRAGHWADALRDLVPPPSPDRLAELARAHRLSGGTIRRVAPGAVVEALAAGRTDVTPADITVAARAVRPEIPLQLATRVEVQGGWDDIVVPPAVQQELLGLERRCRHREQLAGAVPGPLMSGVGAGVRVLFSGPSGTGKTLAARVLAAALGKDLYRLDLQGVVNKYLGETEKNLERVLGHVEELDVVLLLDEGEALLARRTDVQNANDRYANLETNYLLQRLEGFDGIVVITTNAERHLDAALGRRLDVIIHFPAPGPAERAALWRAHLPRDHAAGESLLRELAGRCALTGGQIRNAVMHACLLAIDAGGVVTAGILEAAVRREYAKLGALCPLRAHPEPAAPGWPGSTAAVSQAAMVRHG
jgi:hypothetical protein